MGCGVSSGQRSGRKTLYGFFGPPPAGFNALADLRAAREAMPTSTWAPENVQLSELMVLEAVGPHVHSGFLYLAKHSNSGKLYTLRSISKNYVKVLGGAGDTPKARILVQKDVSSLASRSVFCLKLVATFCGENHCYFLFEPVVVGNLCNMYEQRKCYGNEDYAKFYGACIILALDFLHRNHIIHQGLQPDCIYLVESGQVKLDVDTANQIGETAPFGYASPEVNSLCYGRLADSLGWHHVNHTCTRSSQYHAITKATDWWNLGVVLYKLMTGKLPFDRERPDVKQYEIHWHGQSLGSEILNGVVADAQLRANIIDGIEHADWPSITSLVFKDFIVSMLRPRPIDRLPESEGGIDNLKRHAWYQEFDWQQLEDGTFEPPFKPGNSRYFTKASPPDRFPYEPGQKRETWDAIFCEFGLSAVALVFTCNVERDVTLTNCNVTVFTMSGELYVHMALPDDSIVGDVISGIRSNKKLVDDLQVNLVSSSGRQFQEFESLASLLE